MQMQKKTLKQKQYELTHVDVTGAAKMVNVGSKPIQRRYASAQGKIFIAAETLQLIQANQIKKGDVLTVAQIAGIQAAKQTAQLIPLCHSLGLDNVELQLQVVDDGVIARSKVYCTGRTGVEMEALTAVSVALLTVYDMCKAVDKQMSIGEIVLLEKVKQDDDTAIERK
jgi:cyclic pyranopterin monophosphate synthase